MRYEKSYILVETLKGRDDLEDLGRMLTFLLNSV
jgi:hypothetical protein